MNSIVARCGRCEVAQLSTTTDKSPSIRMHSDLDTTGRQRLLSHASFHVSIAMLFEQLAIRASFILFTICMRGNDSLMVLTHSVASDLVVFRVASNGQ